tara:strand:- start:1919 stop:2326 length:408 start_codon:yes stop_codon:yes gene_type:complete
MKSIHNLETLKTFVQSVTNKSFNIDTGSQSFNVYPTEHVEIAFYDHRVSIEVGSIVYGNLSINEAVIEYLEKLIPLMCYNSDELGDYVCLNCCDDGTFNISFGGIEHDVETFNFDSIVDVIAKIEMFEFEEVSED